MGASGGEGCEKDDAGPAVRLLLATPGALGCGGASWVPQGVGVQAGTPQPRFLSVVGAEEKEVPRDSPRACCQH